MTDAEDVWRRLVALVMENREDWRRSVIEATGLPFSRVRALRRLADRQLTLAELAEAMTIDAPAATVAVNDLEQRGLVRRDPHPSSRRSKLVSVTEEGHAVLATIRALPDHPPTALTALSDAELDHFARLLDRTESAAHRTTDRR